DRELKIVDCGRAVERKAGENPALHPVDEIRCAARLDHMTAQSGDHRAAIVVSPNDCVAETLQAVCCESSGEAVEPVPHRGARAGGLSQVVQEHLARSLTERFESQRAQIEFVAVRQHRGSPFPMVSTPTLGYDGMSRSRLASRSSAPAITSSPIRTARNGTE